MSHFIDPLERRQLFAITSTGSVDTSFASDTGLATVTFRSDVKNDSAVVVNLLADAGGRSYVVAQTAQSVQVKRLDALGNADDTYANARGLIGLPFDKPATDDGINKVAATLDAADRLLLLVNNVLYRFTTSGKIDKTFGTNGAVALSGVFAGTAAVDADANNRIYLSGSVATSADASAYQFRVVRLRSSGKLDPTFGMKGRYTAPLPSSATGKDYTAPSARGLFVRVLDDNSVIAVADAEYTQTQNGVPYPNPIAAGVSSTATGLQSLHFTAAGALDTTYARTGLVQHYLGGTDVEFAGEEPVGILPDGRVVSRRHTASADSPEPSGTNKNYVIDLTGNASHTYYLDTRYTDLVLNAGQFEAAGNTEFVLGNVGGVSNTGRSVFTTFASANDYVFRRSSGQLDATFNGTGTIAGVDDIALPGDGSVVTATSSVKRKLAVNVQRRFGGLTPTANLAAKPVTRVGSATFNVTYRSPNGFNTNSGINGTEISVIKPDGTVLHPRLLSETDFFNNSRTAYYNLSNSGTSFTAAANGVYTVSLNGNIVTDAANETADARTLGTLTVAIV